jgi:hypothetical protein
MNRDVMQSAGLEIYAEIGIILFVFAFVLVLARVVFMKNSEAQECGNIPLEDGTDEVRV